VLPRRWCPACEWNVDREPPTILGLEWADRRLHRVAVRLTTRQFAALARGPLTGRRVTAARVVTLSAAVVLLAGVFLIAGLGVRLVLAPNLAAKGLGVLVLAVAFVLRPRLGRLSSLTRDAQRVERGAAPELFGLVERVAAEVGAPRPHILLVGPDLNAFTTTVGVRRRRVLHLGLPLWAALDAQERVALLGHELGHFVNGDVRRGLLTQAAETTLGHVANLLAPAPSGVGGIIEAVTRSVGWVLSRTAMLLQLVLIWISQRDSQRAEYLADELGARAAGTAAAIGLADKLLLTAAIDTVIRREARAGNGMPAWRAAAVAAGANQAPNVPLLRLLSRHTGVSLFASHPPTGLRAEMLEKRRQNPAAVRLGEAASARIDEELDAFSPQVRRTLAEA